MKLQFLTEFRKDEQGGILAFYLIMFMMMMVGGGMSIDFIRQESKRESLQDALDRGVLAAAGNANATNPTTEAELAAAELAAIATVRSYIQLAGFDPDADGVSITPDFTIASQRIEAYSNFSVDTYFLRLSGIKVLNSAARSAAKVSASNIEMSLVLDVSGSMDFDVYNDEGAYLGRRIDLLQTAAKQFAATLLSGNRPSYTSISVVPFSGQVAISDSLADEYVNFGRWNPWQDYSNCMKFNGSDYRTTAFDRLQGRYQYEHFKIWGGRGGDRDAEIVPWCPQSNVQVMPLANDLATINDMLDDMSPQGATNTWTGIKWGAALLDPSTRQIVSNLTKKCPSGICEVDPLFEDRPAQFSDKTTLKFLIVMADGRNTPERDMAYDDYNYNETASAYTQDNADYWNGRTAWSDLRIRTGSSTGDTRMQNICTAAKDNGITIFTIGTDISPDSNAHDQMLACASTPGHYYSVGAEDLAAAFNGISNTIQKLRLVN